MATISGTIKGISQVSNSFSGADVGREVWLVTCDFAAYTGASDTASISAVGAAITARVRDGKTRTIRWAGPAFAGTDTANQDVYATGASVSALTVSSDDLTGNLSTNAGVELTSSTASKGVGVFVCVDAA